MNKFKIKKKVNEKSPFVDLPLPDPVPLEPPPPPAPVEDVDEDLSWATDEFVSLAWLPPPPSKLKEIYKINLTYTRN